MRDIQRATKPVGISSRRHKGKDTCGTYLVVGEFIDDYAFVYGELWARIRKGY